MKMLLESFAALYYTSIYYFSRRCEIVIIAVTYRDTFWLKKNYRIPFRSVASCRRFHHIHRLYTIQPKKLWTWPLAWKKLKHVHTNALFSGFHLNGYTLTTNWEAPCSRQNIQHHFKMLLVFFELLDTLQGFICRQNKVRTTFYNIINTTSWKYC